MIVPVAYKVLSHMCNHKHYLSSISNDPETTKTLKTNNRTMSKLNKILNIAS